MTFTIWPFLLIVLSLGTLIVLFVRKLPQLTLLDVDNIPEVKEEKKKEQIFKKRVAEKMTKAKAERLTWAVPIMQVWKGVQKTFRQYVGTVERRLVTAQKKKIAAESPKRHMERVDQLRSILHEGEQAMTSGETMDAEKRFLEAIRIDPKNVDAYRGLADVYLNQRQFNEAKETYQFILHLRPNDDAVFAKLAEVAEAENNIEAAIHYYEQAVLVNDHAPARFARLAELLEQLGHHETALEAVQQATDLEPQNPKYLDMLVEISIMAGNKAQAKSAYQALRMANPENQKLAVLKQRIEHL